jgi:hypothetical protein
MKKVPDQAANLDQVPAIKYDWKQNRVFQGISGEVKPGCRVRSAVVVDVSGSAPFFLWSLLAQIYLRLRLLLCLKRNAHCLEWARCHDSAI